MPHSIVGPVQTENRGHLLVPLQHLLGDEQVRGHARTRLRLVSDEPPDVLPAIDLVALHLRLKRAPLLLPGELAHDRFRAANDLRAAILPLRDRLHLARLAVVPAIQQEVVARQSRRGLRLHREERNARDEGDEGEEETCHGGLLGLLFPGLPPWATEDGPSGAKSLRCFRRGAADVRSPGREPWFCRAAFIPTGILRRTRCRVP